VVSKILEDNDYKKLNEILSKKLDVSYEAIYGYNYNTFLSGLSASSIAKSRFLSLFLLLFSPFTILILLFKKNKKNIKNSDLTVEEWRKDTFEEYYKSIVKKLDINVTRLLYDKRAYNIDNRDSNSYNIIKINDYIEKKILLKILFFIISNFKFQILLCKLSLKYDVNVFYIFIKCLIAYIKFQSLAINLNTKVYLSANDLNAHILKYEILHKFNTKYIVVQSSMRVNNSLVYKGSDLVYCYGSCQAKLYNDITNTFRDIILSGSIKNIPYLKNDNIKKYDIMFVEQFADYSNIKYASNHNYIKLLSYLIRFSEDFPNYRILYKTREEKRINRTDIDVYEDILNKLERTSIIINDKGDSYDQVQSSRLVTGYFSALCFESIGLNIPNIFFYYDNYDFELFDFKNSDEDILVQDNSYEIFKDSIFNMLNKNDNTQYFKKYKLLYMNQDRYMVDSICEKIEELIIQ
jgi:hypothetical protein